MVPFDLACCSAYHLFCPKPRQTRAVGRWGGGAGRATCGFHGEPFPARSLDPILEGCNQLVCCLKCRSCQKVSIRELPSGSCHQGLAIRDLPSGTCHQFALILAACVQLLMQIPESVGGVEAFYDSGIFWTCHSMGVDLRWPS